MPELTRPELEAAIRAGGSVRVHGRIITRLADLPSATTFVQTPAEAAARAAELDAQIAALQVERASLAPLLDPAPPEQPGATGAGSRRRPTPALTEEEPGS